MLPDFLRNSSRSVFEWGFGVEKKRPVGQRSTAWHEAKARATKAAVLAGAARVFDRVGYRNAVVSEISKESETTAGAMYHYYPSKEAVALAVVEEARVELLARFEAADQDSPTARLVHVFAQLGALAESDPVARASLRMALEPGTLQEHPMRYLEDWQAATTDLVALAVDAGEVRGGEDSTKVARLLVSGFISAALLAAVETEKPLLMADLATSLSMVLSSVSTKDQAGRIDSLVRDAFPAASI